jgi:AcrR family transcriptional regulator
MAPVAADPTIRRLVMRAASELLTDDPSTPVDRIVSAAGVSRATFYRHFGSRANLLASVEREPRPAARERILVAAQDMLVRQSLGDLSMDQLARAAGVSRGTLYRLFPGKPALLRGLIEAYGPFDAIRRVLREHGDESPDVVLPLVAREIAGVAGDRLGLMRTVFLETTVASASTLAGVGPLFVSVIGEFAGYLERQMSAGRLRRMPPVLALHAVIGPIFFHLMTRSVVDEIMPRQLPVPAAIDELIAVALRGLDP